MVLVPDWYETQSGLLLPTSIFAAVSLPGQPATAAPLLPAELRPKPQPVAIVRNAPSFLDQVVVYANEEAAGLPVSDIDKIRAWIRLVPFEPGMMMVTAIAAKSFWLFGDQTRQLKFAEQVYGDGSALANLKKFLIREGPKAQIFAEQHAFILERLMIEEALDVPLGRKLTRPEAVMISRSLLGCTAIASVGLKDLPEERKTLDELMAVFMQNGAYNSKSALVGEMARVVELFGHIAHHSELLSSTDKICPLDGWMLADYGFSVEEQLQIGFALGVMSQGIVDGKESSRTAYLTPGQVNDLLAGYGRAPRGIL